MKYPDHLNEAHIPTPIVPLHHFFTFPHKQHISLKRDDFTGMELSGNKVRKLGFLLKEALDKGAGRVITCGGVQSNHCRATAFYATKLGLKSTLVLRGEKPARSTGNYLLENILGVDIRFITAEEYKRVDAIMAEMAAEAPEKTYVIPEGGSNEVGAWGYIKAFEEIMSQKPDTDTIVVATGSGGTHSGLLLGKLLNGSDVNILSVNVCDNETFFQTKIDRIMKTFCQRYGYDLHWSPSDIHILDGFVGEGYALIGPREVDVIQRMAQSEGLIMDPVYGAKAMAGFEHHLKENTIPGNEVVFIHTGGIFGIFAFAEMF